MNNVTVIKQQNVKHARYDYHCNASEFIKNDIMNYDNEYTFAEKRIIVKARQDGWMVKKGDPYILQFNKQDGEGTFYFRAIPAMHEICIKYDLYDC